MEFLGAHDRSFLRSESSTFRLKTNFLCKFVLNLDFVVPEKITKYLFNITSGIMQLKVPSRSILLSKILSSWKISLNMKEYKLNSQLYFFILHECLLDIITLKKLETFSNKNPRYQSKFYSSLLSIETAQLEDCERCWDTEGCSELTIVTTISCCFLIELQQLKLSAAWPGIKLTGFENIFLITSLYINLNFQF